MSRLVSLFMFLLLAVPAFAEQPCSRVVSFGYVVPTTQGPSLINYDIPGNTKGWIDIWVKKNAKNYPDVCFLPNPLKDHANFLVVLSYSPRLFKVFQAKPVYTTNASWAQGSGTIADNHSPTENLTHNGEVTMTSTVPEDFPYKIHTNVLYANAYNDNGFLVSQQSHVYNTHKGGNGSRAFGHRSGNAPRAITARDRLITASVDDVAGPALVPQNPHLPPTIAAR
jgi:hypothetical protein